MNPPLPPEPARRRVALLALPVVFLAWGFVTVLNDILIPQLKALFDLGYFGVMLVQVAFFGAYFVTALPWGGFLARHGYRNAVTTGLAVAAGGALLMPLAATAQSWGTFLLAFLVLASGITLLQVSCNPWMSLLGPPAGAAGRLSWAQAWNAAGTLLAPLFGAAVILGGGAAIGALAAEPAATEAWRALAFRRIAGPYLGIGAGLLVLAAVVHALRLPAPPLPARPTASLRTVLRLPHVRRAAGAVAAYFGAEVAVGSFMILFLMQPATGQLTATLAALGVALYWGGSFAGRLLGAILLPRLGATNALVGAALLAAALLVVAMTGSGAVAAGAMVAVGFCNSVQYPTIFSMALRDSPALAPRISSLLVMGIVGAALVPPLQGALADRIGLQSSYLVPLACYGIVALWGWRNRRDRGLAPAT